MGKNLEKDVTFDCTLQDESGMIYEKDQEDCEMSAYSSRGYTSRTMPMYYGQSYAGRRNARRDSMGRYSGEGYSRAAEGMVDQLRDLMETAPDEQTRMEIHRMVERLSKT